MFSAPMFCSVCVPSLIPSINFISPLNRHYVKMRQRQGQGCAGWAEYLNLLGDEDLWQFVKWRVGHWDKRDLRRSGYEGSLLMWWLKYETCDIMVSLWPCTSCILITTPLPQPQKLLQNCLRGLWCTTSGQMSISDCYQRTSDHWY